MTGPVRSNITSRSNAFGRCNPLTIKLYRKQKIMFKHRLASLFIATLLPISAHSADCPSADTAGKALSTWLSMIVEAGLTIEAFGEPMASPEVAEAEPVVADTRVAPIFLHIRTRKL
ncbi:hypothetical protein JOH51_002719 [Rhizobium leguminosarum]|nr:hypothetical protein [Rhizobium leguminosarum]